MKLTKRKINRICADAEEHIRHYLKDNVIYADQIRVKLMIVVFKEGEKIKTGCLSAIDQKFS